MTSSLSFSNCQMIFRKRFEYFWRNSFQAESVLSGDENSRFKMARSFVMESISLRKIARKPGFGKNRKERVLS